MRRALVAAVLIAAAAVFVVLSTGASNGTAAGTYKIQFDNAFGLVTGADFKVAGVPAGTIKAISLPKSCQSGRDPRTCYALVTIQVTHSGFGQFHADAQCESRPQSLIGEYYIDCNPGSSGQVLKPGSTIPVSHTQSTIPGDVVQDIMRMPYRQRLTVIVNELGAAAAARGGDLQAALQRAVPALTETDQLLNVLASDSSTLQALTKDSDSVVTALANNNQNVKRFIADAGKAASDTATQQANLRLSLARLPGLLEQLRPTLAQLGTTVTTNQPVLQNLNQASGQLNRLFTDLPAFSRSAKPAIRSLGQASVTGRTAVTAANPTVADLNRFAKPTPDLAQNLAIVLHDIDDRSRAVEPDPRSPGGKGFTGLEALLGYVFNQTLAVNTFGPEGHVLAVDAFFSAMCSAYATPQTIANNLKLYGSQYRQCYSWLGPNQPGVNETDPSNPGAPVPDPGGAPPGQAGPSLTAAKMAAVPWSSAHSTAHAAKAGTTTGTTSTTSTTSATSSTTSTTSTAGGSSTPATAPAPSSSTTTSASTSAAAGAGSTTAGSGTPSPAEAQQLLNYLLAP